MTKQSFTFTISMKAGDEAISNGAPQLKKMTALFESLQDEKYIEQERLIKEFKDSLETLLEITGFGKIKSDNYDGQENYINSDFYFTINEEPYYHQPVSEIFNEVINKAIK